MERTWLKMTSVVVVQVTTELRSDVTQVRNTHQKEVVMDWMTAGVLFALICEMVCTRTCEVRWKGRGERARVYFSSNNGCC